MMTLRSSLLLSVRLGTLSAMAALPACSSGSLAVVANASDAAAKDAQTDAATTRVEFPAAAAGAAGRR